MLQTHNFDAAADKLLPFLKCSKFDFSSRAAACSKLMHLIEQIRESEFERKERMYKKLVRTCVSFALYFEVTQTALDFRIKLDKFTSKARNVEYASKIKFLERLTLFLDCYDIDRGFTLHTCHIDLRERISAIKKDPDHKFQIVQEIKEKCLEYEKGYSDLSLLGKPIGKTFTALLKMLHPEEVKDDLKTTLDSPVPVTIYIWGPTGPSFDRNMNTIYLKGDVGHVAIGIGPFPHSHYFSHWPHEISATGVKSGVRSKAPSFWEDVQAEGKLPTKVTLYSLNSQLMIESWEKLRTLKWQGTACGKKSLSENKVRNCGSMCAQLLVLGGIRNLCPEIWPQVPEVDVCMRIVDSIPRSSKTTSDEVKGEGSGDDEEKEREDKVENSVSLTGIAGFLGVNFWTLVPIILPSNFLSTVHQAKKIEEKKLGSFIIECMEKEASAQVEVEEKILEATGINLGSILKKVKKDLKKVLVYTAASPSNNICQEAVAEVFSQVWDHKKRNTKLKNQFRKMFTKVELLYQELVKNHFKEKEISPKKVRTIFNKIHRLYAKWLHKLSNKAIIEPLMVDPSLNYLSSILSATYDLLYDLSGNMFEGKSKEEVLLSYKLKNVKLQTHDLRHANECPAYKNFSFKIFKDMRLTIFKTTPSEERSLELNLAFALSKAREMLISMIVKKNINNKYSVSATLAYLKQKFASSLSLPDCSDRVEENDEDIDPKLKEKEIYYFTTYNNNHKVVKFFMEFINTDLEFADIVRLQLNERLQEMRMEGKPTEGILESYYDKKDSKLTIKGAYALLFSLKYFRKDNFLLTSIGLVIS